MLTKAQRLVNNFCTKHQLLPLNIQSGDDMEAFFCFNPLLSKEEADTIINEMLHNELHMA